MPKFSISARHASHQDGNKTKKTKDRGHQYRDAAKARKLKQTRIKGLVEEIAAPVEPGKARPLRREPKYNWAKIGRMIHPKDEDRTRPVNTPTVPVASYTPDPVNLDVPRVIVPTSEATAKRKQAAAGDDDGDTTDVDDSEDVIVVPAGFVDAAENLGLLSALAASGPHKELEEPPSASHAQPDEKPPTAERLSTEIEPSLSRAAPRTTSSTPSPFLSPSTQPSHVVPGSVEVEVVYSDSQTVAATSSRTYLESFGPSEPILVPQTASAPESFQEAAWSSAPQYQNSTCWDNNTNDVNMEFSGAVTLEPPVYSLPTTRTPHEMFYSHVGQAANNNYYQTYTMDNIRPNWASGPFQPVGNESIQHCAQINQPPFNQVVDALTAATCFWISLSRNLETSQSPATAPEIIESTSTQSDGPRTQEEPSKFSPSRPYRRRHRPDSDSIHPFPNLRGCKNMRLINMSEEGESPITMPRHGYRRLEKPPLGSEMDLINRLRMEAEGLAEHGKRRRDDSQLDSTCTSNPGFEVPPRQRQRREPYASKLKTPVPAEKRSRKLHRRCSRDEALSKEPTSPQTPTSWNFSRFCPSVSSLANRLFNFF